MPGKHTERGGLWRYPAGLLYGLAETVCLLPVLLVWLVLYRWSPDPP